MARIRELRRAWAERREGELFPVSRQGNDAAALALAQTRTGPLYDELVAEFAHFQEESNRFTTDRLEDLRRTLAGARQTSLSLTAAGIAVGVILAAMILQALVRRLTELARTAEAIAGGALDSRAPEAGNDEVARLGRAFNRMTEELARRLAAEAEHARDEAASRETLARTVAHYGALVGRFAEGDLRVDAAVEGEGNLAVLGANLRSMRDQLRAMAQRVQEAVGTLGGATAEILATAAEQSSGATETAAAVTQTVATVDEVAQTASQSSDRANAVAAAAQRSVAISTEGQRAVDTTLRAMGHVQAQVNGIAERILLLSEQAQAVGQIITTVNELAEQSNLLALNAAIEAARAGEHGRGFAVVAQEIRALAEQSKRATGQVRTILGDIQKSTHTAVLATEEGNKAVQQASEAAGRAGERIQQLASTIAETSSASEQIVLSVQQQHMGMAQISQAMHAIQQASSQAAEATRQTERAARDLSDLSTRLRDAVSQYRT